MNRKTFSFLLVIILFCFLTPVLADNSNSNHGFPEPDPPFIEVETKGEKKALPLRQSTPSQEWVYHKTSDNQHPDGNEQQMMWLMNRARSDPAAEGIWLSDTGDSDIDFAIDFFDVDITVLQNEFASYDPAPPAAFDRRLYYAAKGHSEFLISTDAQNHDGQFDLITDEGFSYRSCGGNVYSYAKNPIYGHAGFNIDWGYGDSGMQTGRGHRVNLMSIGQNFYNVGKAVVQENDNTTSVGPLVVTENYCEAFTSFQDHYNNFIVGTVWTDSNSNSQYDPGEGEPGVTVTPDTGTYYAVTADSGGYAVPVTSQSIGFVTFSGTSLGGDIEKEVTVGSESILLDIETSSEVVEANPVEPDIKANGSDGPVTINAGEMISISLGLDTGSYEGTNADWWLARSTPDGNWYYIDESSFNWENLETLFRPAYQGALFNLDMAEFFHLTSPVAGTHMFYFAVDTTMDALLNETLYYDYVSVKVE